LKSLTSPKVIVIGASGGVGTYGVQIAKAFGAYVVGICSARNAELVKSLGADEILDYTVSGNIARFASENKDTYDIVLDGVGGDDYWKLLAPTLKSAGVYSTAAGPVEHNGSQKVGYGQIAKIVATVGARKLFGSRKYEIIGMLPPNDMTEIATLFEEGKIKTHIPAEQIFSLKDGIKAHEVIESHRSVGKVILLVDE
jgi:NADPH2:quinone reductase